MTNKTAAFIPAGIGLTITASGSGSPNRPAPSGSVATAAQAASFQASAAVNSFTVRDTAANIAAAFDALNADTKLTAITLSNSQPLPLSYKQYITDTQALARLPQSVTFTLSGVPASAVPAVQANTAVKSFTVADSPAIVQANLAGLAAASRLTAITLIGGTTLPVNFTQYQTYTATLDKLSAADTISVSAATAAAAATLQANFHVGGFAVTDTAPDVTARLTNLAAATKLSSISLTGGTTVTVSYAQWKAWAGTLDKLAAGDSMIVNAVPAASTASVAADPQVGSVSITDSLANIGASIASLQTAVAKLSSIAVADSGQNLSLTAAQFAADSVAISLMTGTFTITHPVINLIWDASVANAPAGFVAAVQDAANYFDALITSPITVNIDVGYGEYHGTPIPAGILGETQILNSATITTAQFRTDLAAVPTSPAIQSALANLSSPSLPTSVFVEGGEAKAFGITPAYGTAADAAIGFALDPTGRLFTYDPNNRGILGQVDFIAVAEAEIGHALGRVAFPGLSTALDLFRYTAPLTPGVAGTTPSYFSVDGGITNLDNFATSTDYGDWAPSAGHDAVDANIPTGYQDLFTPTDVTELNVLGYAIAANPPASSGVIPASAAAGLNATSLTFIGSPVMLTMGTVMTSATVAIPPPAGIEEIAGFTYATDKLTLNLSDLSGSLQAFDTSIGGVHAIALTASNDETHGIVLTGMPIADTAANLIASHLKITAGTATIT